jgi:serine/threonine protein kinase
MEVEQIFNFEEDNWSKVSSEAVTFIKSCLKYDPEERMTAIELLGHKWLSDLLVENPPVQVDLGISSKMEVFS